MQTLTLGAAVTAAPSDARGELGSRPPPAFDGLEAPLVTPLGEPPAGDQADAPHPVVDRFQRGLTLEIEDYVGVGRVDLTRRNDPVRILEDTDIDERASDAFRQVRPIERLAAGVGDLAGDPAMTGRSVA